MSFTAHWWTHRATIQQLILTVLMTIIEYLPTVENNSCGTEIFSLLTGYREKDSLLEVLGGIFFLCFQLGKVSGINQQNVGLIWHKKVIHLKVYPSRGWLILLIFLIMNFIRGNCEIVASWKEDRVKTGYQTLKVRSMRNVLRSCQCTSNIEAGGVGTWISHRLTSLRINQLTTNNRKKASLVVFWALTAKIQWWTKSPSYFTHLLS